MDMHSREQYLATLRAEYQRAEKKQKSCLLDEAQKRTRLNRKVLIRKLAHPPLPPAGQRTRNRAKIYGAEVKAALAKVWEMFGYPCGQRLAAILRAQVDSLRQLGELQCDDMVAGLLKKASPRTLDRLLAHERSVKQPRLPHRAPVHPLMYQRVPVKLPNEWDREELGNLQLDFVLHCGHSTAGQYLHTLSTVDIASGWWEGEPQMGRSQEVTNEGLGEVRTRFPFPVREIHPDNDSAMLNDLIWRYCRQRKIRLSRSRPYQKNDNAWVEQKNWTHVRQLVGYRRYDTEAELDLLKQLYRCLADFQNFFQPVMKRKEKVRVGGKIHRKYEQPATPYQRLKDSGLLQPSQLRKLELRYQALNPAELSRQIRALQDELFHLAAQKDATPIPRHRRGRPFSLRKRRKAAAA